MRIKFGKFCMALGLLLMMSAAALLMRNHGEARAAEESAAQILPQLIEQLPRQTAEDHRAEELIPLEFLPESALRMAEVEIGGYGYIGFLSLPTLELELPVMAQWDYNRLRTAPCRYAGTLKGEDLVIMAHNYQRHFGRLSELALGDLVIFTDAEGIATHYHVVGRDVLAPGAVEEMTAGEFDLTLFTCTYGGQSRVTVYCDRLEEK